MKKFIILVLAAAFCLAMVLPASAEVKVGGMIGFDIYSNYQDEALKAGGVSPPNAVNLVNDERNTQMNTYTYTNYLTFKYTGKDGSYGATTGIYMGKRNDDSFTTADGSAPLVWVFDVMDNHIWWKPMPDVKLKFGHQAQIIGGPAPPGILGSLDVVVVGITAGNIAHTSNRFGITADIKINDMVSLIVGMYDPDDDGTASLGTVPDSLGGFADEELDIPRFDIALPIKYGNFSIRPAASWVPRDYDQVAFNADDDFDIWELAVSGKYTYGPLALTGEIATGENMANANYAGPVSSGAATWVDAAGYTHIEDGEGTGWWLNLAWTINPKMNLNLFYGTQEEENDVSPALIDDIERERTHYGFRFNYYIASNFMFIPSYIHWDYGDDNLLAGTGLRTDSGSEDVIGAGFLVYF
jgi:hypothetical protein